MHKVLADPKENDKISTFKIRVFEQNKYHSDQQGKDKCAHTKNINTNLAIYFIV